VNGANFKNTKERTNTRTKSQKPVTKKATPKTAGEIHAKKGPELGCKSMTAGLSFKCIASNFSILCEHIQRIVVTPPKHSIFLPMGI
jgi:hypothetical protein